MKKVTAVLAAMIVVLSFSAMASAAVDSKFYGYQWVRYQFYQEGASAVSLTASSTFSIPRTYLRWKVTDAELGYSGNLTLDVNMTKGGQENQKIDWAAWMKYGYVELTNIPMLKDADITVRLGQQKVYFGTIDSWEYPMIEKNIDDKLKVCSSADMGVALDGNIPGGWGNYQLALYNGIGYKNLDSNMEKAYNASLLVTPIPGIYVRGSYLQQITSALGMSGNSVKDKRATAVVVGGATGPIEGSVEYLVSCDDSAASASKTGVTVGVSTYLGVKVINPVSVHLRWDTWNPDTKAVRDEMNMIAVGTNVQLAGTGVVLQLNYQLEQPQFPDGGSNNLMKKNKNTWTAQAVWNF
ncbi:MAG: hypothetical protein LLG37_09275 [Spirochaetia bacterium]|nr:hypothetical protein [Spirochaetia bacterium]